jgi:molybdopterin converting factor small subunit
MTVNIPSPLRSYTNQQRAVEIEGGTVDEALALLDRRYPGFRFRIIDERNQIRQHIKIFVNRDQITRLDAPLRPDDVLHIICALSGG